MRQNDFGRTPTAEMWKKIETKKCPSQIQLNHKFRLGLISDFLNFSRDT